MHTIDRAFRLLDTQAAGLGVFLAAVSVAVAVLSVLTLARQAKLRLVPALLIVGTGLLVGTGIVETTYHAWYKHRCVEHHSDIPECDAGAPGGFWGSSLSTPSTPEEPQRFGFSLAPTLRCEGPGPRGILGRTARRRDSH